MRGSVPQVAEYNAARLAHVPVLGGLRDIVCVFRDRRRLLSPDLCKHFRYVPLFLDFSRQRKKHPIKDGLQQYGKGCDGRLAQALLSDASWNVVRCSSGAFFIGGRRMFSFDKCVAGVATHRTDVPALVMRFLCSCCVVA